MKVRGDRELRQKLIRLRNEMPEETKAEIETTGRLIEFDAKANSAVDTGENRQEIHYEATNNGFGAKISANAPHAPFLEFGTGGEVEIPDGFEAVAAPFKGEGKRTVNMPAQPFLLPAFFKHRKGLLERLNRHLKRLT